MSRPAETAEIRELLRGAFDFHCHVGPDRVPRRFDGPGVARHFVEWGFRGALLKDHWFPPTASCLAARTAVPGFLAVPGVALNHGMGGLNAAALETAARAGLGMVFFPTNDAACGRERYLGQAPGGVRILEGDGRLTPAAQDVLAVAARYRLIVGTGHLAPAEALVMAGRARELGIERIVATHVSLQLSAYPLAFQKALADLGVYLEHAAIATTWEHGPVSAAAIAAEIRAVGPERCVISTDYGQPQNPPPAEGYARFVAALMAEGVTASEIRRMACENPAALAPS